MSKRSIKLDGKTTSLFLEDAFWRELETRASARETTWTSYLRDLIEELEPNSNRSASIKESLVIKLRQEVDHYRKSQTENRTCTSKQTPSRWLVDLGGLSQRLSFFQSSIVIGSESDCDIIIDDANIEARHCVLVNDGKQWWVMDCKTKNGTFVNSKKVSVGLLPRQAEITVGKCQITRL